ncbi:MAG: FHA domain-containing protein [Planctomycetaceae bacterium]
MVESKSVPAKSEQAQLFEVATGWLGPLRLTVIDHVSKRRRQYTLERPFALIGHSGKCDVVLRQPDVGYRHAYIQVIGGRVFCIDLASHSGTHWEDGRKKAGWLMPDSPIRIGDYSLRLADNIKPDKAVLPALPQDFNPLKRYVKGGGWPGALRKFEMKFLNAQIDKLAVTLAHPLTLVGRDRTCKFHFDDESVSKVHAGLFCAGNGLWVIDLLGRGGTRVNGRRIRYALVEDGQDVSIGHYRMRVKYRADRDASEPDLEDGEDAPRQILASTILVSSNRIFTVERVANTLIVTPAGDSHRFRYADVHHEANRVLNLLSNPELVNLIVDLGSEDIFTSVAIGVFTRLRNIIAERGGRAALCNTSSNMRDTLTDMSLYDLWTHFPSRPAALEAIMSGTTPPAIESS